MNYQQVETDSEFRLPNGTMSKPLATLSDGFGRAQIALDDGCYVLYIRTKEGHYAPTFHIFREAFEVMITLGLPPGNAWEQARRSQG